ncbi:MAG: S26 family signal peptidase [Candidatus Poseidoniaceae archaeon]|jgi:signal peptidase I|nr:S26 family signal peptidase [Candidatus Poseidoniaceae archaeon]MDP7001117.1 S26 family signal peptidase [Candidatus Poseidoniaceae archaeon]
MSDASDNTGWILAREMILAFGMIGMLILGMWIHTGSMPPLVVVESDSMIHSEKGEIGSIDAGDLILVHSYPPEDIVTYAEATDPSGFHFGHDSLGMGGDVIIYKKNGAEGTPIIHRAILKAVANATVDPTDRSTQSCPSGSSWDGISRGADGVAGTCVLTWDVAGTTLLNVDKITWAFDGNGTGLYECNRNNEFNHGDIIDDYLLINDWDPQHAGFITLGDNNRCSVDQGSGASPGSSGLYTSAGQVGAVQDDWLVGVAGAEIPWLGTVKLALSGNEPGTSYVPTSSWIGLVVSVGLLLALPFVFEPITRVIMQNSPEVDEAEREEAVTVVAKTLFEEE